MPNFLGNPDHPITLLAFLTIAVVLAGAIFYLVRFNRKHPDPLNEKADHVQPKRSDQKGPG
jgi:hypothetical protein